MLLSPCVVFLVFFVQCVDEGVIHSLEVAPPPPDDDVVGQGEYLAKDRMSVVDEYVPLVPVPDNDAHTVVRFQDASDQQQMPVSEPPIIHVIGREEHDPAIAYEFVYIVRAVHRSVANVRQGCNVTHDEDSVCVDLASEQ